MQYSTGLAAAAAAAALLLAAPTAALADPAAEGGGSAPPESDFQKTTLNDLPGEPIDLAVLPDSRVLHTTRDGQVWMHDPDTGLNTLAGEFDVYEHDEEGLQSIAVDPDFGQRGGRSDWVYLYYAPPMDTPVDDPATPDVNEGDAPETGSPEDFAPFEGVTRLSRFKFEDGRIDAGSEQHILDVPADRGICCHVGGDIVFDDKGLLYLSTGDDTNPFASGGYTPIDETEGRNPVYDAQRTSANTDDLRGKVLRIDVGRDGSYTIPRGNLFPKGKKDTRPEIYAMGLRNPFRIEIDPDSGDLYVADYSPDASVDDPARGPRGYGKWAVVDEPANYGWPYCATPDLPYVDYDFATGASGEEFDCANPVNESPHNTGLRELPPVEQPEVWYHGDESAEFPELGTGGIGPMAGPSYEYDPADARGRATVAWPRHYDGVPLFHEFTRDYVKGFHLDRRNNVESIEHVLPSFVFDNPMDLEFGPDGALYVLEYGDGFFAENPDAQLSRIDYIGRDGNHTPVPVAAADPTNGEAPLTVDFSSEGTADADGDRLRYEWHFDTDGRVDSREANPTHTFTEDGLYNVALKVTDRHGRSASAMVRVVVGNTAPQVRLVAPVDGQTFHFGDAVEFEVEVTDDQPVDCAAVRVDYILGHDDHGHPQTQASGCSGTIQTTDPSGHDPEHDDLAGVFVATYTDPGGEGLPPLTGSHQVVLEPVAH
jgi:glucose/arabinose dehydrogenase